MSQRFFNGAVVLIGFASSGKTTVGKLLADRLGVAFVDVDDLTYAHYNAKDNWDEQQFRAAEQAVVDQLKVDNCVVACGGGTPVQPNFNKLTQGNTVVWLQVSASTVAARLGNVSRPLFDGKSVDQLSDFVSKRSQIYKQVASFTVVADDKTPLQVVDEILELLHK